MYVKIKGIRMAEEDKDELLLEVDREGLKEIMKLENKKENHSDGGQSIKSVLNYCDYRKL